MGHHVQSAADFAPLLMTCLALQAMHVIKVPITCRSSDQESNVELVHLLGKLRDVNLRRRSSAAQYTKLVAATKERKVMPILRQHKEPSWRSETRVVLLIFWIFKKHVLKFRNFKHFMKT